MTEERLAELAATVDELLSKADWTALYDSVPLISDEMAAQLDAKPIITNGDRARLIKHDPEWSDSRPIDWPADQPMNSDGIPILTIDNPIDLEWPRAMRVPEPEAQ